MQQEARLRRAMHLSAQAVPELRLLQLALSVKNIDLAKKVRYKKRTVHKSEIADRGVFVGRTYRDLGEFTRVEPDLNVVEMDTIAGCRGSSAVLLSLYLRCAGLQLYYWMPRRRSDLVKQVFDWLEGRLGLERFREVFPVILADRGGEFARPAELETSTMGVEAIHADDVILTPKLLMRKK